jgi:hypothetical protein
MPADDNSQLNLVIYLLVGWINDRRTRIGHTGRCFAEEERLLGRAFILFIGVVEIVQPDTDDLAGPWNGCKESNLRYWDFRESPLLSRFSYCVPVAGCADIDEIWLAVWCFFRLC